MRRRLCGGIDHEGPLLVYVGRLGAEKNLDFLRQVLPRVPNARLALVGDGPARGVLEGVFEGTPTVFAGMLRGEALSQAYASADVFVMPSESETLGIVCVCVVCMDFWGFVPTCVWFVCGHLCLCFVQWNTQLWNPQRHTTTPPTYTVYRVCGSRGHGIWRPRCGSQRWRDPQYH